MALDVTTTGFSSEPRLKSLDGLHVTIEQIEPPSTAPTETAPFAHQCRIAKERRLDCEHIKPRHVASRIATLEHEVLHGEFYHNETYAKSLRVPDGSRIIFDTQVKYDGMKRLSAEIDDLMKEVAKEQTPLLYIPEGHALQTSRDSIWSLRIPN